MFTLRSCHSISHIIKHPFLERTSINSSKMMIQGTISYQRRKLVGRTTFHDRKRPYATNSLARQSHAGFAQLDTNTDEDIESNFRYVDAFKAKLIFQQVWKKIEQYYGIQNIRLPRELFFLMGAPGAGKGTHTPSILHSRGIKNLPIGVSDLLQSPECRKLKDQGLLISDAHVVELMLHAIIQSPHPETGVLIDGFPRTQIQAEVLSLFYEKWTDLRLQYGAQFPRPSFRICVLYIDEETSIHRQLARGFKIRQHNQHVRLTGQGELWHERVTDSDEVLIRERYRTFQSNYDSLLQLAHSFPFHLIDASGNSQQVLKSILKELDYQASFELDIDLYDTLAHIPTAKKVGLHHQQSLIGRLDYYHETEPATLQKAIQYIDLHILPQLLEHSCPGRLSIPMKQISDQRFMNMVVDVLSEKGFQVSRNDQITMVPKQVDLATGNITLEEHLSHSIVFDFPRQFDSILQTSR
ncbi:hypothetical protein BCR42DRAFT_377891 [Absidia repens]|uniref:Adenylate kinase n=1 Tax=Absidia repens TaxID=90262 RepID=A0A1X2IBX1_9FUNG|nr:hypothetical protein BCR42DRAFT_377891 [Absidia repens]